MSKDINLNDLNLKNLGVGLLAVVRKLNRYAAILFFILVAGVYGFVLYRINVLSTVQPDTGQAAQAPAAKLPKIDPEVARQLEAMQDNSGDIKTIFESQRNNPFAE